MPRIQLDKFLKNLRDLTVVRKLNNEGYSLNQSHVSSMHEDLMPEEVEALLRKRYSNSKGKSFFELLFKDYKKYKAKYWSPYAKSIQIFFILIFLGATGYLASIYFPLEKIIPSEIVSTNNDSDYEIILLDDEEDETESEYSETELDYAMKVLRGADDLLKSEAIKNINDRELSQQNMQVPKSSRMPRAIIDVKDFNNNFIKNRKCNGIRSKKVTFNFEITIGPSGSVKLVNYLGNIDSLSRGEKKLLDITEDALMKTSFIPGLSNGKPIQTVIKQPITIPRSFCS